MIHGTGLVVLLALLFFGSGGVQPAEDAPATQPSGVLTEASSVDDVLDALHRAGQDLQSLRATVLLTDLDSDTGDEKRQPGKVVLRRSDELVSFRVTIMGVLVETDNGPGLREERIEYLLQGDELVERNYKMRQEIIRKLPPEQAERDLLKLGEGPFPLPIGQSRDDVRRMFEVREVDPANPDENPMRIEAPEGTRRLRLTPREGTDIADKFRWLEIDVTLADGLPRRVITLNRTGSTTRITDLRDLKINQAVSETDFALQPVNHSEWNVIYEELGD